MGPLTAHTWNVIEILRPYHRYFGTHRSPQCVSSCPLADSFADLCLWRAPLLAFVAIALLRQVIDLHVVWASSAVGRYCHARCVAGTEGSLRPPTQSCPDSASGAVLTVSLVLCPGRGLCSLTCWSGLSRNCLPVSDFLFPFIQRVSRRKSFALKVALMRLCTRGAVLRAYLVITLLARPMVRSFQRILGSLPMLVFVRASAGRRTISGSLRLRLQ